MPASLMIALKVNPNARIAALEDDGRVFWEAMAVNLYVAEKYGKAPLRPSSVADHGCAYQWNLWVMTETEAYLFTLLANTVFLPEDQRSDKAVVAASEALKGPLKVLETALAGRHYLLGNDFTIADLNVASVLSQGMLLEPDLSATPTAHAWFKRCLSRPAVAKVHAFK